MARYRLLNGRHAQGKQEDGSAIIHEKGAVIESKIDLEKLFKNKFERVQDEVQARPNEKLQVDEELPQASSTVSELIKTEEVPEEASKLGEDVSEQFETATGKDLVVLKDGRKYFVARKDDKDVSLNEEAMTTKQAVIEFIENY